MSWKDKCTHDGKFHVVTCFGVAHALGILAVLEMFWHINNAWIIPVAVVGNAAILVHEWKGPGDLGSNKDRIFDWLLPIIVSVAYIRWREEVGVWFMGVVS
jgi:hypothetical protein